MRSKKILYIILLVFLLGIINTVNAFNFNDNLDYTINNNLSEKEYLEKLDKEFKNMDIIDLKKFITDTKNFSYNKSLIGDYGILTAKGAWLAFSQIIKLSGYPLSAELIRYSLTDNDYSEFDDIFAEEIRKTKLYPKMLQNKKGSYSFEKNDTLDLYLSIHSFDFDTIDSFGRIRIKDIYNFEESKGRFGFFIDKVNDFAFLNQNLGVLHPIDVEIDISKPDNF